jgi:hypothetical protein
MLADIDRDRHQLGRVDATDRLGELLGLGAMDMHHEPTTSVRCEENWHFPYAPPEVAREAPLLYQPPAAARQQRTWLVGRRDSRITAGINLGGGG